MRPGAPAGCVHEAVYYRCEQDLLDVVVPFLAGGVDAKEPTVVALGEANADLVRQALPAPEQVVFVTGAMNYARPAVAIRSYRALLADLVADGAEQIRIIGEIPTPSLGATWNWWARYEAAINHAYDDFPLWSMCAYDTRITPPEVLADVARTHPRVALPGGSHVPSAPYTQPAAFLGEHRAVPADPIQRDAPALELVDPTAAQARHAVLAVDRGLPRSDVDELVIAVSEGVTNAIRHGRPPVRVRFWPGVDRIVVEISDGGDGPADPYAGLLPMGDGTNGGLGLWIAHQSCNHVTFARSADGFTLRLTAGNPHFV